MPGQPPLPPIDARVLQARIERVRALAHEAGAKWAFVSSGTTSFAYLTGASVERSERLIALLVPEAGAPLIVAPSFEVERVRRTVRLSATIRGWEESQNPFDLVREATQGASSSFLVEPHAEYGTAMALARAMPDAKLLDGAPAFESLRVEKQPEELARIRRAIATTHDVFERAFAELRPACATATSPRTSRDRSSAKATKDTRWCSSDRFRRCLTGIRPATRSRTRRPC